MSMSLNGNTSSPSTSTKRSPDTLSSNGRKISSQDQLNPWLQSIASRLSMYDEPLEPKLPLELKHPQSLQSLTASDSELLLSPRGFSLELPALQDTGDAEPPPKRRRCEEFLNGVEGTQRVIQFPSLRSEMLSSEARKWLHQIRLVMDDYQFTGHATSSSSSTNRERLTEDLEKRSKAPDVEVPLHFFSPVFPPLDSVAAPSLSSISSTCASLSSLAENSSLDRLNQTNYSRFPLIQDSKSSYEGSSGEESLNIREFSYVRELLRSPAESWCSPSSSGNNTTHSMVSCEADRPESLQVSGDLEAGSTLPTSSILAVPLISTFMPQSFPEKVAVEQVCSTVFDKLRSVDTPCASSIFSNTSLCFDSNTVDLHSLDMATYKPSEPLSKNKDSLAYLVNSHSLLQEKFGSNEETSKTGENDEEIAPTVAVAGFSSNQERSSPFSVLDTLRKGLTQDALKEMSDEERELLRKFTMAATPLWRMVQDSPAELPPDHVQTDCRDEFPAAAFLKSLIGTNTGAFPDLASANHKPAHNITDIEPCFSVTPSHGANRNMSPRNKPSSECHNYLTSHHPTQNFLEDCRSAKRPIDCRPNSSSCVACKPVVLSQSEPSEAPVDSATEEGFQGEDGLWYKRPDIDDECLKELCDLSQLRKKDKNVKLMVEYKEGVNFPLGEGGRELLRACLNAKGCKGRRLQGASVPMLLRLAQDWGLWSVAVRIKVERATGELCPKHEAFVRFKAMQSHLRKFLKREQMHTERDMSGQIIDIRFEEMKSLTLGKEGREKLRTQLRRLHDRDPHRMDTLLEQYGFKYSELRNATVPQLLKMAHICCMWDEVIDACKQQEAKRDKKGQFSMRKSSKSNSIDHISNLAEAPVPSVGIEELLISSASETIPTKETTKTEQAELQLMRNQKIASY